MSFNKLPRTFKISNLKQRDFFEKDGVRSAQIFQDLADFLPSKIFVLVFLNDFSVL